VGAGREVFHGSQLSTHGDDPVRRWTIRHSVPIAAWPGVASAQVEPAVTINSTGTFNARTGQATISGTFTCGGVTGGTLVEVSLSQSVGRVATVSGEGFADVDGGNGTGTGTWSAPVSPTSGEFRGGKAFASARLAAAPQTETSRTVQLNGKGRPWPERD
jgi:hypothetical protein